MAAPADPLRLQVVDRVVAVLSQIRAGDNYFYTPRQVSKRFVHWNEAKAFPCYSVSTASGGKIELEGAPHTYDEDFYISVKGIVQDQADTVTKLERCIRDVRKAIDADSSSGAAGSLSVLAANYWIDEPPETDDGYLVLEGFGFFDQRIRFRVSGTFGVI
jgi:hypothetical protein